MEQTNLSTQQATELLQELGVQAVVVSDETQAVQDFNVEDLLTEVDAAREPIIKAKIGADLEKETRSKLGGVLNGAMRSAGLQILKERGVTGVSNKDLDGLSDKALLAFMVEKLDIHGSKGTEDLRKQIEEMSEAHESEKAKLLADKEAEVAAANEKYVQRDIDVDMLRTVNGIPRIGGDVSEQAGALKTYLQNHYALVYNPETGKTELRDKNNPEAVALNQAKSKQITVEEAAKGFFGTIGVLKTDNRHENPKQAMEEVGANGAADRPAHMAADPDGLQKHIDSLMQNA
jgi:hypothetical protein